LLSKIDNIDNVVLFDVESLMEPIDEYCPICHEILTGDYNNYKYCSVTDATTTCRKICCIGCIALTACQTTEGICMHCFDHKCRLCKKNSLPRGICYLDDEKPTPICYMCKSNV
jgi:hypothetical protein